MAPGTYTVGSGGNYSTLTAAIADYNTRCLSGAVTFSLLNASYTTGTGETMPLNISANPYASATNTLTIKPATGVTASITGATTDILRLNGADYVTIDGSNNGTSSQNLSLVSTNTTSGSDVVFLISLGAGKGAINNTIKNCIFQAGSRGTGANAATVTTFYGIYSGNITKGQGPDNDNITVTNNVFKLASIGVLGISNATGILNNWVVTNNTFGDNNTAFSLSRTGFSIDNADNITFTGNTFNNINTTDLGSATGISLGTNVSKATIRKNTFKDVKYSGTGSFGARAIDINTGIAASNIIVDNNTISNISGAGSNSLAADALSGIRVIGTTDGVKIYFNSINLGSGTFAGNANGILSSCVYVGVTATGIDLRNNILNSNLDNTGTANDKTYALYSDAASTAFTTVNYNNYSTSGVGAGNLGFIGSARTNLAGMIAGFGGNANSTSVTPVFTSATDLHLATAGNSALDNKGQVIATYTTDFDGQTRDIFYPDMGFDEFTSTDNQWIGVVSTAWNNKANWASGVIPSSAIDVTIPAGTPFAPVLNLDGYTKNLIVATGATLGLSSFTLNVAGMQSGAGSFVTGTASKLVLSANGALGTLNIATPGNIGSLTMSGTGATLTLGSATNVYGTLDVKGNTLTTGGNLTLKSNVSGTASVAAITGSGNITGNVTVERFIPQNAFRAWRMLSVPVQAGGTQGTFKTAWQENQAPLANTNPGFGMLLTSIAGGNGYDAATSGNSLLTFTSGNPGAYTAVSNTNNAMATNAGYFAYVRGNRSSSLTGGAFNASATTLRTNGPLYVGSQSAISLPAGNNVMVGNVYASAIDFDLMTKSGVSGFSAWDPKIAGTYNIGAYNTYSTLTGWTNNAGSYIGATAGRIESGQAIILNSTGGGSITLTEAAKVTGSRNVFKTNPSLQILRTKLYATTANGSELADGNAIVFSNEFSNGTDEADILKPTNFGENLGIKNGKILAVEGRSKITSEDIIEYAMSNLKQQQYSFEFTPENMDASLTAYLEEKFDGTRTPVSMTGATKVKFTITSNTASSASDRFRIVFQTKGVAPIASVNINASKKVNDVQVNWKVSSVDKVKTYEVEHSVDGTNFEKSTSVASITTETNYSWLHLNASVGTHYYRIRSITVTGEYKISDVVKVVMVKGNGGISIYPNPVVNNKVNVQFTNQPTGNYSVSLVNKAGQVVHSAIINNDGSDNQTLNLPISIPTGSYQMKMVMPDGKTVSQSLIISGK